MKLPSIFMPLLHGYGLSIKSDWIRYLDALCISLKYI